MLGFAAFLFLPTLLAFASGVGAGWLGRFLRAGWWWTALMVLLTLLLPVFILSGDMRAVGPVAFQFPAHAGVLHSFQWQTTVLMLLTAASTLWSALRDARLAAALPLLFFGVFYRWVLPPLFADVNVAEVLLMQLDGDTNRGLFMACLFGSAALFGFGVGRKERLPA